MSAYNNPLNFPPKDVRARCRAKHGAKWWDVDKETKKRRMDAARLDLRKAELEQKAEDEGGVVLCDHCGSKRAAVQGEEGGIEGGYPYCPDCGIVDYPPESDEDAPLRVPPAKKAKKKKPLKKVYRLRINDEEEGRTSKMWEVDAAACIGPEVKYKKLFDKQEAHGPGFWSVYLFGRSRFSEDELEEEEDEGSHIWLGSHPIPGYGDKVHYGHVKKGDTKEHVAQTLLSMEHGFGTYTEEGGFMHGCVHTIDNKHLVIEKSIWENALKTETRERLLRDSFAETIYIADTWF